MVIIYHPLLNNQHHLHYVMKILHRYKDAVLTCCINLINDAIVCGCIRSYAVDVIVDNMQKRQLSDLHNSFKPLLYAVSSVNVLAAEIISVVLMLLGMCTQHPVQLNIPWVCVPKGWVSVPTFSRHGGETNIHKWRPVN